MQMMRRNTLIKVEIACLLVVDVWEKLWVVVGC